MSSVIAIPLAIALPWLFGSLLARWLLGRGRTIPLYLGLGYILGTLAIVWLLKTWDAIGWSLSLWPMIGALLLLIIIVLAGTLNSREKGCNPAVNGAGSHDSRAWRQAVILLLFMAMGVHLFFVIQELLLRPTFPWDAWRGWEPKVIQFHAGRSLDAPMTTIGNYGEISTHALLWMMLASGTTHEPFLHLPWLLAYVALAAIVYGHLREGYSGLVAALGAYMVMSLPYLSIHVALAGYADIWLALAFTLGVLALRDFRRHHRYRQVLVALLMATTCFQAKRAGAGFAAVLLVLAVIEVGMRAPRPLALAVTAAGVAVAGVMSIALLGYIDLELPVPGGRRLLLSSEEFGVTGLLRFTFDPEWHATPLLEALLLFGNWHLVAFLWLGITALILALRKWPLLVETENLGILCGLVVIALYFTLVSPETALDHSGLSRALLYVMPLAVVWLLKAGHQLATTNWPR